MKNFILSLALIIVAGASTANASGEDPRAEKKFSQQFSGAQNVKWTKLEDGYLRVTFILNGIGAETYFDKDSEIVGTVRNLFYGQLPLSVVQAINNKFGEIVPLEAKEITNEDGTSYRVLFEQKSKKYSVRVNSLGEIIDKQKIRK